MEIQAKTYQENCYRLLHQPSVIKYLFHANISQRDSKQNIIIESVDKIIMQEIIFLLNESVRRIQIFFNNTKNKATFREISMVPINTLQKRVKRALNDHIDNGITGLYNWQWKGWKSQDHIYQHPSVKITQDLTVDFLIISQRKGKLKIGAIICDREINIKKEKIRESGLRLMGINILRVTDNINITKTVTNFINEMRRNNYVAIGAVSNFESNDKTIKEYNNNRKIWLKYFSKRKKHIMYDSDDEIELLHEKNITEMNNYADDPCEAHKVGKEIFESIINSKREEMIASEKAEDMVIRLLTR
jgi:hypothetical protein